MTNGIVKISDSGIPLATSIGASDLLIFDQVDPTSATGYRTKRLPASLVLPGALPASILPSVNFGHVLPFLDTDVQFSGNYLGWVTGGTGFSGILIGAANSSITGTPTAGETPGIQFQWGAFNFTVNYTVQGGDTNSTIAAGLVAAIQANATIANSQLPPGNGIFAQYIGGTNFNIQWNYALAPTLTAQNSAHTTVTIGGPSAAIDAVVLQLGRAWGGRTTMAGDALIGFDWTGPNSSSGGTLATHWAQIVPIISNPAAGSSGQGGIYFNTGSGSAATGNAALARMILLKGLVFYDSSQAQAAGGDLGAGTINLPSTGFYSIGGATLANSSALYAPGNNLFGGIGAGSALNLQSTQSGSPSGDFVQVTAGGVVRQKWFSGGGVTLGSPTGGDPGAGKLNIAGTQVLSNNVAIADAGAWTAFTPGLSCGTATFTVNSARFKTLGKITYVEIDFTITAIGTGGATTTFTLPNTPNSSGALSGAEVANNHRATYATVASGSTTATCMQNAGTAFLVNDHVILSGVYENQ